jgi:hypothetical protein
MMKSAKSSREPRIISEEITYAVRLNYVIFPLEFRDLRNALARNGYELARMEGRIPPRPTRVGFAGEIARKGEIEVHIDSGEGEIAVRGRSLDETTTGFEQVLKVIQTELDMDIDVNVWYYSLIAHYTLQTGTSPHHTIPEVVKGNPFFSRFNEILGEQTCMFSVRLCPTKKIPNRADWFDIAIEPDVLNADAYHIGVVFRHPDKGRTQAFIKNLKQVLFKLLKVIEGKR